MPEDVRGSLKRRWLRILGVSFAGGFLLLLAMVVTQSWWFGGLALAHITVCNLFVTRLRCPRCRDPLLWRPLVRGSQVIGYWSPIIPARCPSCELPL